MSNLFILIGLVVFVAVLTSAVTTLLLDAVTDNIPRVDRAMPARSSRLGQHAAARSVTNRSSSDNGPPSPQNRSGCGCLTVPGVIALLEDEGYQPARRLEQGGVLLTAGEAAAAVWPGSADGIAAVQFGSLAAGPAKDLPASHLGAAGLRAASRNHRASLAAHPIDAACPGAGEVRMYEPVYPLNSPQATAQHGWGYELAGGNGAAASRMLEGRPPE